jgi:hypothetical protein
MIVQPLNHTAFVYELFARQCLAAAIYLGHGVRHRSHVGCVAGNRGHQLRELDGNVVLLDYTITRLESLTTLNHTTSRSLKYKVQPSLLLSLVRHCQVGSQARSLHPVKE